MGFQRKSSQIGIGCSQAIYTSNCSQHSRLSSNSVLLTTHKPTDKPKESISVWNITSGAWSSKNLSNGTNGCHLQKWWYTSFHSAIKQSPFEALYNYPPPMIGEFVLSDIFSPAVQLTVTEKQQLLHKLKENLQVAQERMKMQADKLRTERQLKEGAMVYIRI